MRIDTSCGPGLRRSNCHGASGERASKAAYPIVWLIVEDKEPWLNSRQNPPMLQASRPGRATSALGTRMSEHHATVTWKRGAAVFTDRRYSRAHEWQFDGGASV